MFHFVHRADTPDGTSDSIQLLLAQGRKKIDVSKPGLQVLTFGGPAAVVAGERKRFPQRGKTHRTPEFLLYLILEGGEQGLRWSEVTAAIWPDLKPEKASTIFHQTLKRLRNTIFDAPDYIALQNDYYYVNPDYFEWCDALTFDKLFERAAKASPDEALALHLELVSLYDGEFLSGFELGEWGDLHRTRYEAKFLQVAKLAADQLLENGSPREAPDNYQQRVGSGLVSGRFASQRSQSLCPIRVV